MYITKKIAVVGALGGLALAGIGAGQAFADGAPKCVDDGRGNIRCVQKSEYRLTDKGGKLELVNKQSLTCSTSGEMSCNTDVVLPKR
ncbi:MULTISPECIES: hypothetical protein [Streptomyces]|jgi:hypothetical protein|uniref:hypothetical protein n=1 Tax=Streptomyces TaxID=1883 RepID=UPI001EFC1587|nr:hypothetical protein [Streptomyces sp. CL12-4]MCG8968218.1 hypothetical protein [Streptomyces sp. CL12-4]